MELDGQPHAVFVVSYGHMLYVVMVCWNELLVRVMGGSWSVLDVFSSLVW